MLKGENHDHANCKLELVYMPKITQAMPITGAAVVGQMVSVDEWILLIILKNIYNSQMRKRKFCTAKAIDNMFGRMFGKQSS